MTTYTKSPTKRLKSGDTLEFNVRGGTYEYEVHEMFLHHKRGNNAIIFEALGIDDKYAFCSAAYGHQAGGGEFPTTRNGLQNDLKAITRVVRALYARIEHPSKKDRAEMAAYQRKQVKAAKAQQLAERKQAATFAQIYRRLSARGRRVVKLLQRDDRMFGCQRKDVVKLVSAMLGEDLTSAVKA